LAHAPTAAPHAPPTPVPIGVGIDTSRYGHYAAFLRQDHRPAADELAFPESADGYALLRQRLQHIARRHPRVCFHIRLDVAGLYADNLLHFLRRLAAEPQTPADALPLADISLSWGDPQRNKNYRAALFGGHKSDPVEARAAARFAVSERPAPAPPYPAPLRALRQVAGRLQAAVRQRTRLVNQLHQLLALTFPELALLVKDLSQGWVLELLHRYPTAERLAAAGEEDLAAIPYLPPKHLAALLGHARSSVASLPGPTSEALLRDQVRQLRDAQARQKRLEDLLVEAYRGLPRANHLDTIPGIGPVSAAVLTAFILDIDRFETPGRLVAYFGVLPTETSSGIDRDGRPRGPRRWVMSRRGNDLVRRYLWMAALSAVRCNPAVRPLYQRVVAKHPRQRAVAIGHAMRKLLHLAFALWKSGRPFDAGHYPWSGPASPSPAGPAPAGEEAGPAGDKQAAGHKPPSPGARPVVTAACAPSVADGGRIDEETFVDFAHLKRQLSMTRALEQLGLWSRMRGGGGQYRGTCPIHRGDARGRTFSVNVAKGVFHCFDARCGKQGDVIDLWAEVHQLSLRAAALDLVRTFDLEPAAR
jgi:transposase